MIDRRRSLEGIPILNQGVSIVDGGEGNLKLVARMPRKEGFLARFQPPVIERSLKLDELGSYVVGMIDNRRTVLEIVDSFVAKYKLNRREAELSTVEFMKSLVQRGVVSIAIK